MSSGKQIKMGATISYVALLINILVTIFYTPWMVNKIGRENYGLYTLAISLISVFMLDFGLSSAVARFISKYRAEGRIDKIEQFVGAVFKLYFLIDIVLLVVLIVIFVFLETIYKGLSSSELKLFKILYLIVAGFNLISFPMTPLSGILSAYEKFAQLKICDLFNKLFTVVAVVCVLSLDFGVVTVVLANAIIGILTIIIKLIIIKKFVPMHIRLRTVDTKIYKEIFSFSLWTTFISIAQRLTYNMAPSILAMTSGSIAVALYSPASAIGSYYFNIAVAINGLFLPTISRMISEHKEEHILNLMIKVGRYQTFILGLILVGFFCVGDIFMVLWMGEDFYNSYYCTILIMIPALLEYSQQIANTTIVAKNYVKNQALLVIFTSVLGCVLSFILSQYWKEVGTCIALCVVGLVNVYGLNKIHKKKLGINIAVFYRQCYGKIFGSLVLSGLIGRILVLLIPINGVIGLIIKGIIIIMLYCVLIWLFSMNQEEKVIIKKLIHKL